MYILQLTCNLNRMNTSHRSLVHQLIINQIYMFHTCTKCLERHSCNFYHWIVTNVNALNVLLLLLGMVQICSKLHCCCFKMFVRQIRNQKRSMSLVPNIPTGMGRLIVTLVVVISICDFKQTVYEDLLKIWKILQCSC